MTKGRWRESMKSLGSHIDPGRDEQLRKTNIEVNDRVAKIKKLIHNKNRGIKEDGNSTKDSQLVELVDDFHKQYQVLYALYDTLRGEVRDKIGSKDDDKGSSSTSSSSSSSDSESYHSVDEASARSSPRHDPSQKVKDEFKHKLETSSLEFIDLRNRLNALSEEKEALHVEYTESLSKVQEYENIIQELRIETQQTESTKLKLANECAQLKEKLVEREKELFSLGRAHQVQESKVPTQIKELERQVSSLKLEHKNLSTQKRELEGHAVEAKQLGEENSRLRARILELERTPREKEDTISAVRRKLEENERKSKTKVEELVTRANNLQSEVDMLRIQKGELEEQVVIKSNEASAEVKVVMDQVNVLQQELHSLSSQNSESESSLGKVTHEISGFLVQIETLREKLDGKTVDLQRIMEEKDGLERQVKDLKMEMGSLSSQKSELEEQMESKNLENHRMREEKEGLHVKISQLEKSETDRGNELSALQTKLEGLENDSSSQIKALEAKVNNLQEELQTLKTEKSQLELQIDREKQESLESLTRLEKQNFELTSKITEHETTLKGQENVIKKSNKEQKQFKDKYLQSKLNLQIAEKKIEKTEKSVMEKGDELSALQAQLEGLRNETSTQIKALEAAEKNLRKELESLQTQKSQLKLQIERERKESHESQTRMEKQKKELTSKITEHETALKGQGDVINKLNEEYKQMKDKYLESKLNFQIAEKKIEETAEEFCKKFEDSLRILSRRIRVAEQLHVENKDVYRKTKEKYEQEQINLKERVANTEVAVKRIKDLSLTANDMLTGLDAVALKFEECYGNFLNRISKSSCEVLFAKDWVRRKNKALKHVQEDVDCLLGQLDTKEAEILGLREKVWKLENKVRELEKIVKEKEEGMLGMGEEKREAIRQLCVWIDYHRSRSDYLKKILSEMTAVRSQRTS